MSDRLVGLGEQARALGRTEQADRFLLLAWAAFDGADLPAWRCATRGLRDDRQGGSAGT